MFKNYFGNRLSQKIQKCMKWHFNRSTTMVSESNDVQSHDQEDSKLNSSIIANSGVHTLVDDKVIKSPFSKNNVGTIKKY